MKEISFITGKNVSLVGFGNLDRTELETIKKITAVYIQKLERRVDYTELRIRLKSHQHSKSFVHELEAELFIPGKELGAKVIHRNLNKALALVLTKLLAELEHLKKRSPREQPIRKLIKK